MFIVIRVQWLMQFAHLTLLRLNLLEVAIDDTLERKLILALLFRDTLVLHRFLSSSILLERENSSTAVGIQGQS